MHNELLLTQTQRHLPAYQAAQIEISPIEKGGSDRRFYRVRCAAEQSLVLVKYDRAREENRHYVQVAQFLARHGIRAPKIYFHDADEGLIWIEDLGETDLFSYRGASWPERRTLYVSALREIARLHELPEADWSPMRGQMPPEFNAALYTWEQRYFFENCLGRIFGLPSNDVFALESLPALAGIAGFLAGLPRNLIHRDFQSQNIVVRAGHAHLIDFQGMRPGLAEYDLASLLYDPYVALPAAERQELASAYWEERGLGAEIGVRRELLRLCAMQRLMQALGAYGFLGLVKGNAQFLAHVGPAMHLLREVMAEVKGVEPLREAIASLPRTRASARKD